MDLKVRKAQQEILKVFSDKTRSFALSGGTALELYYLKHRFSADLDFFSPKYDIEEIDRLILEFRRCSNGKIKLESEFIAENQANVRFYTIPIKGLDRPLKIDFVEDVLFKAPLIKRFKGVPVYRVDHIYFQKIVAIAGIRPAKDETGREILAGGRREARDVFDIYMLSKKIRPLHIFLRGIPRQLQRGMLQWYRTFSRQELKLGLLDLDIYDDKFDAKEMILYLESEIREFVKEVLK